jgi:hypothetical protein
MADASAAAALSVVAICTHVDSKEALPCVAPARFVDNENEDDAGHLPIVAPAFFVKDHRPRTGRAARPLPRTPKPERANSATMGVLR